MPPLGDWSPGVYLQGKSSWAIEMRPAGPAAGTLCRNSAFSDLFPGDAKIFSLARQDPLRNLNGLDQVPHFAQTINSDFKKHT
jgi:hypothetical protein